jgi:uncharacterized membrane protein YecN with MAPEG domain
MPIITGWAVLICGAFFVMLTFRVIGGRRSGKVSLGDGGDKVLERRIRGQGNAAEQMPIALIALLAAELIGGSTVTLALSAAIFCIGRIVHGVGFGWFDHSPKLRMGGMLMSLIGTIVILMNLAFALLSSSAGGA